MNERTQANEMMARIYAIVDDYDKAKELACLTVNYILNANPHSNPLNSELSSTYDYWVKVRKELENNTDNSNRIADMVVKEMADAGLTPDQMLEVIARAKKWYHAMKTKIKTK